MTHPPRAVHRAVQRVARMLGVVVITVMATSGCGYRIVKRSDVTARRFAADSAAMLTLERQIQSITAQCRADSLRMDSVRMATARVPAVAPAPTAADSVVKARDAEISSLRELLAKANAELDRIKKRLANPRT